MNVAQITVADVTNRTPSEEWPTASRGDLVVCTVGFAAFSCSLLLYFSRIDFFAFAALVLIAGLPLFAVRWAQNRLESVVVLGSFVLFLFLRKDLSDFTFVVGDASAYTWDAIRSLERGDDRGLFLPLGSALSAASLSFFGLDKIAAINVLASLVSACALFLLMLRLTGERIIAFAAALYFAVQPLSVWFSKTTFSETSWQTIVLLSLVCFQQISSKYTLWPLNALAIAVLSGLLAISNLSRGSGPFLFAAFLVAVLSTHQLTIRSRVYAATSMAASFLATLVISLYLRQPYLIGWQYSRVLKSITSLEVVALAFVLTCVAIFTLSLLSARQSAKRYDLMIVVSMFGFKLASAIALSVLGNDDFFSLLVGNELSFSIENFGYAGTLVALFGLLVVVQMALAGDRICMALFAIYCFGSAPFNLTGVEADQPHELYLYFSRYFFSDLFLVYLVAICVGVHIIVRKYIDPIVSRLGKFDNYLSPVAILVLLCCFVNWPILTYVASHGYLRGSANVVEFIRGAAVGRKVAIFASDDLRYGPYDSAFLLGRVADMNVEVEIVKSVSHDTVDLGVLRDRDYRVICVNLPSCDSEPGLHQVASMAESITWAAQTGAYSDRSLQQFFWEVKAFDYCVPLQFGTEVPIAEEVGSCLQLQKIFGKGWYDIEATHVWSSGDAMLRVPIFDDCLDDPCELRIDFVPFAASDKRTVNLTIGAGGRNETYGFTDQGLKMVSVPLPAPRTNGAVDGSVANDRWIDVTLSIDSAISPRELGLSPDSRTLGISLTGLGIFSTNSTSP